MTATVTDNAASTAPSPGSIGRVSRITGPVVDVEFPVDGMPEQYNLLTTEVELAGEKKNLNLEVAQHIGDNMIRAISLQPTDGLVRGTAVQDTGGPITVPVGDVTLGHVFNTTGECLNLEEGETRSGGASTARRRPSTSSSPRPRCSRPASRSSTC